MISTQMHGSTLEKFLFTIMILERTLVYIRYWEICGEDIKRSQKNWLVVEFVGVGGKKVCCGRDLVVDCLIWFGAGGSSQL